MSFISSMLCFQCFVLLTSRYDGTNEDFCNLFLTVFSICLSIVLTVRSQAKWTTENKTVPQCYPDLNKSYGWHSTSSSTSVASWLQTTRWSGFHFLLCSWSWRLLRRSRFRISEGSTEFFFFLISFHAAWNENPIVSMDTSSCVTNCHGKPGLH